MQEGFNFISIRSIRIHSSCEYPALVVCKSCTELPYSRYLVCLTIGPIFLSGAIYLCLARIIVAYGVHLSRFQPRVYTIGFICCDLLSLALQAAGGGITSYATTEKKHKHGVNIMVTGLSLQVFSLVVFIVCCGDFASRVSRAGKGSLDSNHAALRHSSKFRSFLYGKRPLRCGIN